MPSSSIFENILNIRPVTPEEAHRTQEESWRLSLGRETFRDHPYHFVMDLLKDHPDAKVSFAQYERVLVGVDEASYVKRIKPDPIDQMIGEADLIDLDFTNDNLLFTTTVSELMKPNWLRDTLIALPFNQELAINSKVVLADGQIRHFGVCDLNYPNIGAKGSFDLDSTLAKMKRTLQHKYNCDVVFYHSGASWLHLYVKKLFTREEWLEFNGNMLLMSPTPNIQLVDTRWIAHALKGNGGRIRWSTKVRNADHDGGLPFVYGRV